MRCLLLTSVTTLVFCGCVRNPTPLGDGNIQAFVPVYANMSSIGAIEIKDVRPTLRPGKIYVYRSYILQNEMNEGIHVIDNSNPASPAKVAFITIPFNTEMAVYGDYLYANSINDLVVIDMRDPLHPVEVTRVEDAFPLISQEHPPGNGYFVCPDPTKGTVIDWVVEDVKIPSCRR